MIPGTRLERPFFLSSYDWLDKPTLRDGAMSKLAVEPMLETQKIGGAGFNL